VPRPLSKTFDVTGFDNEGDLERSMGGGGFSSLFSFTEPEDKGLTGKRFLKKFRDNLNQFGQSTEYSLTPPADTESKNRVSVGPTGFSVTENTEMGTAPKWSLELNPWMQSGSFRANDFQIGGTAGYYPSAFISKGPFRLDVGSGFAPVPTPEGTQSNLTAPGKWAQLSVDLQPKQVFGTPAEVAVDEAVSGLLAPTQSKPRIKTAREEADEFLSSYQEANPDYYRY